MLLRDANKDDIAQLVMLAKMMHLESKFRCMTFSESKVEEMLRWSLSNKEGFCIVAEVEPGLICGGLLAYTTTTHFSHDKIAQDAGLFIAQSHRGSTVVVRMIRKYIEWAKDKKCVEVFFDATAMDNNDRFVRLLEIAGFNRVGYTTKYAR